MVSRVFFRGFVCNVFINCVLNHLKQTICFGFGVLSVTVMPISGMDVIVSF